jgi:hypothetical protein
MMSGRPHRLLWAGALVFIVYFFAVGFHRYLFAQAGGIHFVRQSDALAFVAHFRLTNAGIFEPGILSLNTPDGKAVCEFPLIYYVVAHCTDSVASATFMMRSIMLCSLLSSVFYLYLVLRKRLGLYTLLPVFLCLSSGILIYYSANLLPEVVAFSCCITGLALITRYLLSSAMPVRLCAWAMLWFSLASLFKVTYSIYPIALALAALIGFKRNANRISNTRILALLIAHLILVTSWYIYAASYSVRHGDEYFLLHARPLWERPSQEWWGILKWPWTYWGNIFLHWQVKVIFFAMMVFAVVWNWNKSRFLSLFALGMGAGVMCFLLLFANHLRDHDYYLIVMLPFALIAGIMAVDALMTTQRLKWYYIIGSMVAIAFGVVYSVQKVQRRFDQHQTEYARMFEEILSNKDLLLFAEGNVGRSFVVVGDPSYNGSLVALDRFGWTVKLEDWTPHNVGVNHIKEEADFLLMEQQTMNSGGWVPQSFQQVPHVFGNLVLFEKAANQ